MKKYILSILLTVACCVSAMAGDGTKVVSGSFKPLKNLNATVYFLPINFEGATWDQKTALTNHYPDLENLGARGLVAMTDKFNAECKKMHSAPEAEADFVIMTKVDNMDSYYNVMGWGLPGHVTKIWGTVTIIDKATNTIVVEMTMTETDGGRNLDTNMSFVDAWDAVGDILAERINKGK